MSSLSTVLSAPLSSRERFSSRSAASRGRAAVLAGEVPPPQRQRAVDALTQAVHLRHRRVLEAGRRDRVALVDIEREAIRHDLLDLAPLGAGELRGLAGQGAHLADHALNRLERPRVPRLSRVLCLILPV